MADTGESDLSAGANSEFIAEIKDDLELLEPDLLAMEEEGGEIYESIEEIWPDYPTEEDYLWNEDEY